jgi:hypothetical protein
VQVACTAIGPAATAAALQSAMAAAGGHIRSSVPAAVAALLPGGLPAAVVEAAAKVVMGHCLATCAQRLLEQVRSVGGGIEHIAQRLLLLFH